MGSAIFDKPESEIADFDVKLQALWYAAHDQWDKAHELVQDEEDPASAWIHAYLHRVEGDIDNAHYWYRRAKKAPSTKSLENELHEIALNLTEKSR